MRQAIELNDDDAAFELRCNIGANDSETEANLEAAAIRLRDEWEADSRASIAEANF